MNNEDAIKVLNNSIKSRQNQITMISALVDDPDSFKNWLDEQKTIIQSLKATIEQLESSESKQSIDFGLGNL